MKTNAHFLVASHPQPVLPRWSHDTPHWQPDVTTRDTDNSARAMHVPPAGACFSKPMRAVVVLAFCQSLFFAALWLLLMAQAGAAPANSQPSNSLNLVLSSFKPISTRDPFTKKQAAQHLATEVVVQEESSDRLEVAVPTEQTPPPPPKITMVPVTFQLQGTLYQSGNPSAIINGTLVFQDKTVTLTAGNRTFKVVPVEIGRESVRLHIGDRTVDLRMDRPQLTVELPDTVLQ